MLARDRAAVDSLLRAGADPNASDDPGDRPLHYAARVGDSAVVARLLAVGADVHLANESYLTALHVAAREGRLTVTRLLLAAGARADAEAGGVTALHLARAGGHDAIVALLTPLSPAWAAIPTYDTIVLARRDARDLVWQAAEVMPLAYAAGEWWVAVAYRHSGVDGTESPCRYTTPWARASADGGMWIERWRRAARDSIAVRERIELAAPALAEPDCTPQPEIERRFAEGTRDLRDRLLPGSVWLLSRADTFRLEGPAPHTVRFRVQRDSTAELPLEGDVVLGERALLCFASPALPTERCTMIDTHGHGERISDTGTAAYAWNRVAPVAAAVHRDTIWVFGLHTHGQRLQPAWVGQPLTTVPAFLGRVPINRSR